jgi:hypothetical protein
LIPSQLFSEPQNNKIAENIYNKTIAKQETPQLPPFPVGDPKPKIINVPKPVVVKQVYKPVVKYESGVVQQSIIKWADFYGADSQQLLRVASCESGFRPEASNGTHFGVFQFAPSTFIGNVGYMKKRGLIATEAEYDYWNPEHNVQVAVWMFSIGQQSQWSCK